LKEHKGRFKKEEVPPITKLALATWHWEESEMEDKNRELKGIIFHYGNKILKKQSR